MHSRTDTTNDNFFVHSSQFKKIRMNVLNDHVFAAKLSFEQLSKGKIWMYILPSLIVAAIFGGIFLFFHQVSESANVANGIPWIGEYVTAGIQKTVGFFVWIVDQFYMFSILTLLSPINCLLSEKVDNEVTGAKFDGGIIRIMTDLGRAILILIFTMLLYFLVAGCWAMIAWILGFHLLDPIIYFLITAFFLGFSFYDFNLERYGIGFFGTVEFGFSKMAYMFITGAIYTIIYALPIVGLLLAPFLVTVFSTVVYLKMNNKIPNKQISTHP